MRVAAPSRKPTPPRPGPVARQASVRRSAPVSAAPLVSTEPAGLATIVDWLRVEPRSTLPHRAAAEQWFDRRFTAVAVYRGGRAREACAAAGARAFSVGSTVAFAESAPSFRRVVHELAHVVQQGAAEQFVAVPRGRLMVSDPGSVAEREATRASHGDLPRVFSAAPVKLYRDELDTDEDTLTTDLEKRLFKAMKAAQVPGSPLALADQTEATAVIGVRSTDWFAPIYKRASLPFAKETYQRVVETTGDLAGTDLKSAFDASQGPALAARGFVIDGRQVRLARVAEPGPGKHQSYAVVGATDLADAAAGWSERVQDMRVEQRMRLFARGSRWKIVELAQQPKKADQAPMFGIRAQGAATTSSTFPYSSTLPFQKSDYLAFLRAEGGLATPDEADQDLVAFSEKAAATRGVPLAQGRAYVAPVVEDGKKAFYYTLLPEPRESVQFADKSRLREQTDPAGILAKYKSSFVAKLRAILDGTTKSIEGQRALALDDDGAAAGKMLVALAAIDKLIDDALAKVAATKQDATLTAPTTAELTTVAETARGAFVKAVVDNYADVAAMHQHIGVARIFPSDFERIRGTILEDWVGSHYPVVLTDPKHIPVFGKRDGDKLVQSAELSKLRRGDGKIVAKDRKQIIFEAKFVTKVPSDEHQKQMIDYARIIGWDYEARQKVDPLVGYFYDASAAPAERWVAAKTWSDILYVFSSPEQETAWQPALKKTFGEIYLTKVHSATAGSEKLEKLLTGWTENPTIELTIDKPGARTDFTFPPFPTPAPVVAGVTLTKVDLTLAGPGDPTIAKGSVTSTLDDAATKGVVSSQAPATRPIEPLTESERIDALGAIGKKKPKIFGRVTAKLGGLKSKLDDLLQRVTTSAKLITGGLEATIAVSPGASGIPGFTLTEAAITVTVGPAAGKGGLAVQGKLGLAHESGKIAGGLSITYKDGLVVEGTATVTDLVEGLKPFTLAVKYAPPAEAGGEPTIDIGVKQVAFEKRYRGVYITGTSTDLRYDVKTKKFSGNGSLSADLGRFGKASVEGVRIVDNSVEAATFKYASPDLAWPKKNPTVTLGVVGSATYDKGAFSGALDVTAKLTHKHLKKLNPKLESIELSGHVAIAKDGSTSGFIQTESVIPLGKHFQIPAPFKLTVTSDGNVTANFTVELINIETRWVTLQQASLACVIDRDGFRVTQGRLEATIGGKGKKFAGTLVAAYAPEGGFSLGLEVDVEIKPGLVAHGSLSYSSKTGLISGALSTQPITILDSTAEKELFRLVKQIRLFGIPFVVGLYLDLGIVFAFKYGFKLTVSPKVELIGFALDTFTFEEARAAMTLGGELFASLEPTPQIGLGGYLIDPLVLRGGGGLRIPISAKARLVPSGTFTVSYRPDGGLSAAATVGLALKFGITASVEPYAEFVLLDGVYRAPWVGSPLSSFVILPERDLFSFNLDFGKSLKKADEPALPAGGKPAEAAKPTTRQGGTATQEGSKPVKEEPKGDARPGVEPSSVKDEPAGEQEGFSLKTLVDKLLATPPGKAVKGVIEEVKAAYELVKGIIGKIWGALKGFVGAAVDSFTALLKGVREKGLSGYLKQLLKGSLDDTLFFCIEPVLDVFVDAEDKLLSIFTGASSDPFTFALQIVQKLFGVAWGSLKQLVSALRTMFGRGRQALGRWLNFLVQNGKLGVLRHEYYVGIGWLRKDFVAPDQYKIHVGFDDADRNPGPTLIGIDSGIAIGLWLALELFSGVQHTKNPSAGNHDNYWTEDDK